MLDRPGWRRFLLGSKSRGSARQWHDNRQSGSGCRIRWPVVQRNNDHRCQQLWSHDGGGAVYCWGWGELTGDGTDITRTTPVAVNGGHTFQSISGGHQATCAVTTGGDAYCWGYNGEGEFGDGTFNRSLSPTPAGGGLTLSSIHLGNATCGITPGGAAYCWGDNRNGEVGDGTITTFNVTPQPVSGGLSFSSISPGLDHTCGVTTSGDGYCWGRNHQSQLGNGTTTDSSVPVALSGGLSYRSISAGAEVSCGLTTGGSIYCWGDDAWNALGDGSTSNHTTPQPISGGRTYSHLGSATVYARTFCAISTGGPLYCWGSNYYGQLGVNTTAYYPGPPVQPWLVFESNNSSVAVAVEPSLTFTVSGRSGACNGVAQSPGASSSGTAVGLGRINAANGVGAQDLAVSTNAVNGFTVYARRTGAFGLADVGGSNVSPAAFPALGTEGFGYTTSDATLATGTVDRFTNGGAKWAAMTTSNAEVSAEPGVATANIICVAYQAGVGPTTPAGTYATTVVYTAVARF